MKKYIKQKIDEAKNNILEETKHSGLMIEKLKKVCRALNYFKYFLFFRLCRQ